MILKNGSNGVAVSNLQKNLITCGFGPLAVDGIFGQQTLAAVRAFQRFCDIEVDGIVGPETQGTITKILIAKAKEPKPKPSQPEVPVESETPWMDWMSKHEGEKEISGSKDNPFIMSLYKYGNYPEQHDEVPWCAVCANAALRINGYKGTNRADAKSFDTCGDKSELKFGAIVTIRHKEGGRHVAFFSRWVDESSGLIELFGGNQSNALKKSTFNVSGNKKGKDEIVAVRWPQKEIALKQA